MPRSNRLLAGLPVAETRAFLACCETVQLNVGEVLHDPEARIRHVYFPLDSFISLISSIDKCSTLEVGLVGDEGMLGASLILGVRVAPQRALVQGAGLALRLEARQFLRELERRPMLRRQLMRYLHVLMGQLAQMSACTRFHLVEARVARWILMIRDRARSNEFHVTHEVMAHLLGVRRVGITLAASALQSRKLISYSRGKVIVLDGLGLQFASCRCYAAAAQMYEQFMSTNSGAG